jgi:iron complex outermembrane receptor protein
LGGATLLVMSSGLASAQQQAAAPAASGGAPQLQEVVVTAQRREQNIQNVPIAVTAFTTEQLLSRNITDLRSLTLLTPNVNLDAGAPFSGDSSVLSASIRGIGQDDFAFNLDPGVGVYLDGVFLARTIAANQNLLDVDRIEILKGPQGTLFGANTIGGAISIVTHTPGDTPRVVSLVTGGSFNRRDVALTADLPISSTLLSSITFSSQNRDGYQQVINYPANTVYGQIPYVTDGQGDYPKAGFTNYGSNGGVGLDVLRGKLVWKASDSLKVTFTGDWQVQRQSAIPNTVLAVYSASPNNIFGFLYNYCISQPLSVLNDPTKSLFGPGTNTRNGVCGPRVTGSGFAPGGVPLGGVGYVGYGASFLATGLPPGPQPTSLLLTPQPRLYWDFAAADTGNIDTTYGNGPSFANNDVFGFSTTAEWALANNMTFKSITGYRQIRWLVGIDLDGTPETIQEVTDHQHQWQVSQEFQILGKAFDSRLNYVGGLYYFKEAGFVHDYVPFDGVGLYVYDVANDVNTANYAVYGHVDYKLTDQLGFTLGGRYTDVEKRFQGGQTDLNGVAYKLSGCQPPNGPSPVPGKTCQQLLGFPDAAEPYRYFPPGWNSQSWHVFDPTVGLQYHVTPDVMPYFSWSKGFKAGGWTTRLSMPIQSGSQAAFAPEYSKTYELGLKSEWLEHRLLANVALFHTNYDGIQLQVQEGASPVTTNAGNAIIKGAELEMQALVSKGLSVNFSGGWLDAYYTYVNPGTLIPESIYSDPTMMNYGVPYRDTTRSPQLPKTPKYKLALWPEYDQSLPNSATMRYIFSYTYTAAMYNEALNLQLLHRPVTHLIDASVHYVSPSSLYEIAAGGTNLANDRYLTTGNINLAAGEIGGTYSPPRQWYVSLTARLGQ